MREFMNAAKALADESRVRILMFLREEELCVCQIVELLELAPSTVSKHMSILYGAGLVESRKEGRWVYYRLAGPKAPPHVQGAIAWLARSLEGDKTIAGDAKRLRAVQKKDRAECCVHYR